MTSINDPATQHDQHDQHDQIVVSSYSAAAWGELMGICEEFLRLAGPTVHAELRAYLHTKNPPADPYWLIDMLGFNSLHLHRLVPPTTPSPRELWQDEHQLPTSSPTPLSGLRPSAGQGQRDEQPDRRPHP